MEPAPDASVKTGPRWRPGWRAVAAGVAIGVGAVALLGVYHVGHTLRDLGQIPEAISVYERALALEPGFPEIEVELSLLRKAVLRRGA